MPKRQKTALELAGVTPEAKLFEAVIRLEAKVDVALAQHGAELKAESERGDDHEARLRVIEAKSTVSPKVLWSALIGASGLLLGILTLYDRITP